MLIPVLNRVTVPIASRPITVSLRFWKRLRSEPTTYNDVNYQFNVKVIRIKSNNNNNNNNHNKRQHPLH